MSLLSVNFCSRSLDDVRHYRGLIFVTVATLLLSGCLSTKTYVDPMLPKVAVSDLTQPVVKQPVQVFFEFKTNNTNNQQATAALRPVVLNTIIKSNLFSEVVTAPATAERKLFITISNIGNIDDAKARGFTTGLTFGLSGTMVTDGYLLDSFFDAPGRNEMTHRYQHAIYTTIGNANGPAGLTAVSKEEAIHTVMDGLVLNLLKDMSRDEELK
jgi:hypothetical protein